MLDRARSMATSAVLSQHRHMKTLPTGMTDVVRWVGKRACAEARAKSCDTQCARASACASRYDSDPSSSPSGSRATWHSARPGRAASAPVSAAMAVRSASHLRRCSASSQAWSDVRPTLESQRPAARRDRPSARRASRGFGVGAPPPPPPALVVAAANAMMLDDDAPPPSHFSGGGVSRRARPRSATRWRSEPPEARRGGVACGVDTRS